MSKTTAVASYTEAIENLPAEAMLGSLLFFSINRADVNLENARRDLIAAGLQTGTLRKNLRPIDAFRKSSNGFRKRFSEDLTTGQRSELMVRSVGEDNEEAFRHVILERTEQGKGGKRRRLTYDKVAELTFTRGKKDRVTGEYVGHGVQARRTTNSLAYALTAEEDQWLQEQLLTFSDSYDHMLRYMDSHAVRTFVREYIYSLGGICVKESGGLYFVSQMHADELHKLGEWVSSVGSEFHTVPLLNVAEQKAMIMEAFEDEAVADVQRMMNEIDKILSDPNRTIAEKTFDDYAMRAAELKQKVAEYDRMLDDKADRAVAELNLFSKQVLSLADRIKTKATA